MGTRTICASTPLSLTFLYAPKVHPEQRSIFSLARRARGGSGEAGKVKSTRRVAATSVAVAGAGLRHYVETGRPAPSGLREQPGSRMVPSCSGDARARDERRRIGDARGFVEREAARDGRVFGLGRRL